VAASTVILISADIEWRAVWEFFPTARLHDSPFGEWFSSHRMDDPRKPSGQGSADELIFFQGGWGKISAAASTQYVIDRWHPNLLVNLGTCGGFAGLVERGEVLLVEKTLVYDLIEQMGDAQSAIDHYTTRLDLSWLIGETPISVRRSLLISGDRDLVAADIDYLHEKFGAIAGDWESGAIAWTASRNQTPVIILRTVTDLVSRQGGEAYGSLDFFNQAAGEAMNQLLKSLPDWLRLVAASQNEV
jgi:adenosylhomocysteine nucleosidase